MGRLITFVIGVLVGVALKWQYDQPQAPLPPAPQTTGPTATPTQRAAAVQEIAITVGESNPAAARPTPASSFENRATLPDVE